MSKIAVIYWSGTGNTEGMAKAIVKGIQEKGAEADLLEVSSAPKDISAYEKLAFGCPSMGDEVLEESDFEPYFESVAPGLKGKKVALFGSYGWGDGQWMRDWAERVQGLGAQCFDDGKISQYEGDEAEYQAYGSDFAAW